MSRLELLTCALGSPAWPFVTLQRNSSISSFGGCFLCARNGSPASLHGRHPSLCCAGDLSAPFGLRGQVRLALDRNRAVQQRDTNSHLSGHLGHSGRDTSVCAQVGATGRTYRGCPIAPSGITMRTSSLSHDRSQERETRRGPEWQERVERRHCPSFLPPAHVHQLPGALTQGPARRHCRNGRRRHDPLT